MYGFLRRIINEFHWLIFLLCFYDIVPHPDKHVNKGGITTLKPSEIYKINGRAIPEPTSASPGWEDVHSPNSGRTLDAQMHIEVVARKRKVAIKYDVLTQEEMQSLQAMLQDTYYSLTYLDPLYGRHTIRCYISSAAQELYSAVLYDGLWRNVTFNAIEI